MKTQTHFGNGETKRVCLRLDSLLQSVQIVETTACKWARDAGFDDHTVSSIAIAVREAMVNAVAHGNRNDAAKHVVARFECSDAELKISVADEGAGFDADKIPDPLAAENLLRPSGRGVLLMRAAMDEVHFRQLMPGTEVTLVKRRTLKEIGT